MNRADFIEKILDLKFTLIKGRYGHLTASKSWQRRGSMKIIYNYGAGDPFYVIYKDKSLLKTVKARKFSFEDHIEPVIKEIEKNERYQRLY
jgi:hypothetical protein